MEDINRKDDRRSSSGIQQRASQTWNSLRNLKTDQRENDQEAGGSKEKSQERREGPEKGLDRVEEGKQMGNQLLPPTQYELLYQDAMARV